MSDVVRYGVIGTGMMGVEHINNINHLDGAMVTAIADPSEESRRNGAAAAGGEVRAFAGHDELLAAGLCDAVVVATPNMTHAGILLDVLASGVHVLAEKPLCTTVEDCRRVVEAAAHHDGVAWMGLEYRYMAPIAQLLREVEAGVAGTVKMVATPRFCPARLRMKRRSFLAPPMEIVLMRTRRRAFSCPMTPRIPSGSRPRPRSCRGSSRRSHSC